jgi:hypothetical protein
MAGAAHAADTFVWLVLGIGVVLALVLLALDQLRR